VPTAVLFVTDLTSSPDRLAPATRRTLAVLFGTGLLFWTNITTQLATIPLYIREFGTTEAQIGIVMGAFAIGLLLARPQLGRLADLKSRVLVLRIGCAIAAIAPLLYLLADSVPLLFAVRVFHGVSMAAFTTAYSTLVTDIAPPHRRGETIGYMSLVTPISLGFGPALGNAIATQQGFTAMFATSAVLGAFSLGLSVPVAEAAHVRETRAARQRHVAETVRDCEREKFWSLLLEPRLLVPSLTLLLVGTIFGTIVTFIPLFVDSLDVDLNIGLFYSAAALASFGVRPLVGKTSDTIGRGPFVCLALLCYVISMAMLSSAVRPSVLLVAGFIEGAGAGALIPTTLAIVSDRSKPEERGRLFSLAISGFDLGVALAGPLLGQVAGVLGYRSLFAIASGMASLGFVLFATQNSKNLGHSLRFSLGRERDIYAIDVTGITPDRA